MDIDIWRHTVATTKLRTYHVCWGNLEKWGLLDITIHTSMLVGLRDHITAYEGDWVGVFIREGHTLGYGIQMSNKIGHDESWKRPSLE